MSLKNLFVRTPTTDGVLASFRKTLTQLEDVIEHHHLLAGVKDAEASAARALADLARTEKKKAVDALSRLESVFGINP